MQGTDEEVRDAEYCSSCVGCSTVRINYLCYWAYTASLSITVLEDVSFLALLIDLRYRIFFSMSLFRIHRVGRR
jgi:hypothetical protein